MPSEWHPETPGVLTKQQSKFYQMHFEIHEEFNGFIYESHSSGFQNEDVYHNETHEVERKVRDEANK